MKKFIILLIKIASIIFIALGPINILFKQTNYYRNKSYEIDKMKMIPDHIKLANLGSSHGQLAFYYSENLSYKAFNFALSSQTPEYDYALLKSNIDNFDENAVVLIPISYFSLYLFENDLDFEFKLRNDRYYSILKPSEILEYSPYEDLVHKLKYETGRNILNFSYIINDTELLQELKNPFGNFPQESWTLDAYRLENIEQLALDRWNFWASMKFNLEESGNAKVNQQILKVYENIVDLCLENNITPVFVTLPVTSYLNYAIPIKFLDKFNSDVQELVNKTNTLYLNYSQDTRFIYDLSLFLDTDHINKKGAEFITKAVIFELETRNILKP